MEDTQFIANLNIKKRKNTSYDVLSFWEWEQYRYSIRQPKGSQKVGSDSRGVMLAFTREQACASVTFWEKERQSEMRSRFFA